MSIWAFLFEPMRGLDLYEYYYRIAPIAEKYTVFDYINQAILKSEDFMYVVSLIVATDIGFPPHIMTSIYVGLYYFLIYKIVYFFIRNRHLMLHSYEILAIVTFSFFSVLPILVFSVARTLAAIDVIYLGIYYFLKGRWVKGILLCLTALTYHLGMFLLLFVLLLGLLFHAIRINSVVTSNKLLRYLFLGILAFFVCDYFPQFIGILQTYILDTEVLSMYSNHSYLNDATITSIFSSKLMWYYKIGKPLSLVIIYICIVNVRKADLLCNLGISLFLMYSFFMVCFTFISDRIMMFIPVFYGMLMAELISEKNQHNVNSMRFYSLMLLLTSVNLLSIYTERKSFFSFVS